MILFHDWTISAAGDLLGRQYDHLSRRLEVAGELPQGWNWSALIQAGDATDTIPLTPTETGVGAALSRDQLCLGDVHYHIQLQGTQGDVTRHTNIITVFVPRSIAGGGTWPQLPSEFAQLEQRLLELNAHPPVPGESGYWRIWDTETDQYLESDVALPETGGGSGSGGSGTGGTGGGYSYTMTLKNLLDSRAITLAEGSPAALEYEYSSVDGEGMDDGPGVGTLTINNVKAATFNVAQGSGTLDITQRLTPGVNSVKLTVENSEGTAKNLVYTITVVSLTLSTTLEDLSICSGDTVFYYTPMGTGEKTVYFFMDGTEIGRAEVSSSGRGQSFTIPAQSHGGHIFTCYAQVNVDGVAVTSNIIRLGLVWVDSASSVPILLTTFEQTSAIQGQTLEIPYLAYDPALEEASLTLTVLDEAGEIYSAQAVTVPRTAQAWTVRRYPAGKVTFRLAIGGLALEKTVDVAQVEVDLSPVVDGLVLDFDPTGRSNQEESPAQWSGGGVEAEFSGIGFRGADGWLTDQESAALLRILPGGQMTIPFHLFAEDRRDSGMTVEVEMATHNVGDYDSIVMQCLSGGRGFLIASQYASLNSEQSAVSMQFREDEKVRVTFAVEPRSLHRMIYVYVDGILCGAVQYPADDNFAQSPATGITIGAQSSGIDVYHIRLYQKGLTRYEVLDNFIADQPTLEGRLDAYWRNNILDGSNEIAIAQLPPSLPYMVISCGELPQFKGDKKTCQIDYTDPADRSKSFSASGVKIDVQGTSSAGYKKKNFKFTLENGLTLGNGTVQANYQLREDSIPASVFCMKADVASSEGANNVELVRLYNDTVPHKTPPQLENGRVRVGIDGLPCIVFWHNTDSGQVRFWGKYNFNDEKSSHQVYGLTAAYPLAESWEILNNTSNRVLFKSADFSGADWQNDFEARYPENNMDVSRLAEMAAWVASTDRDAVSTQKDKEARLAKFKAEFAHHFAVEPMLYYYLFTEAFLMVDNRAKNFFPTTFDGIHWLPLPYDMDTAMGINNEGQLVFEYDLEDTDQVDGSNVFNAQGSVLWNNLRDAFSAELKELYAQLRSGTTFHYGEVVRRWAEHQAVWPEAVWNEDAWEKYLEPLEQDNDGSYLTMLQGSKASQRAWWLYNGFRYRDSKYQTGDAQSQYITLRCYAVGDITVTPYAHIWPRIKYGSYTVTQRGKRNQPALLPCPLDEMTDTEVYIYSADRLAEIGDLSHLQVGYANFSMAAKLQKLKLGDGGESYSNTRLSELYVGNNELLRELDICNCPNLTMAVDLTGCVSLEQVLATGSGITAVNLPVGGKLRTLELPGTVTNLTIREQAELEQFSMESCGALNTLRIENTPNIPWETLINNAPNLNRVRIIGAEWTATDTAALQTTFDRLSAARGMDASGSNTEQAVVTGRVVIHGSVDAELVEKFAERFPDLLLVINGQATCTVRFRNWDGTMLYTTTVPYGGDAADPVVSGQIAAPTRPAEDRAFYLYSGWDRPLTGITGNTVVTALFRKEYAWIVTFLNWDGTELCRLTCPDGGSVDDPVQSGVISTPLRPADAEYVYTFLGWDGSLYNITEDKTLLPRYSTAESIAVTFVNYDGTVLHTAYCMAGSSVADPILSAVIETPVKPADTEEQLDYVFLGWNEPLSGFTQATTVTAVFTAKPYYTVTFLNYDGTVLWEDTRYPGETVDDPVSAGLIDTPFRSGTGAYNYIFKGWDQELPVAVHGNLVLTAQYKTDQQYRVSFLDWDGTVLDVQYVPEEEDAVDPVTSGRIAMPARPTASQYLYTFSGWEGSLTNITEDTTIHAAYSSAARTFTVMFYNGSTLLQVVENVAYGGSASFTGNTPVKTDTGAPEDWIFTGWTPKPENITGDTVCYAVYLHLAGFSNAYGVLWPYSNSSAALTRLGMAKDFAAPAPAASLTAAGSSPFDNIMPWAGMKRYNIIDGAIGPAEGEDGFSMTAHDTVVYIPPFYYKAVKDSSAQIWGWAVSPTQLEGFALHPGSGRYVGRYHTSGSSTAVASKAGVAPLVNASRADFRSYSHAKGANWWMMDMATWSALQLLYLVEYAHFNSQTKLGRGYGSTAQVTGATDGAAYHTVKGGNSYNQYRWIEHPFGLCQDWVDGCLLKSGECYLGTDPASFSDQTAGLTGSGICPLRNGYITGFGYSADFPWAFIPDTASGGSSSYYATDYGECGADEGPYVLHVGGLPESSSEYGFFYFGATNLPEKTSVGIGSRLIYVP